MAQVSTSLIEVTDAAVEKLKAILAEEEAKEAALRVMVVPNGQSLEYMLTLETEPKEDDLLLRVLRSTRGYRRGQRASHGGCADRLR